MKKYLAAWIAILIIIEIIPSASSVSKGIVIINMDDPQEDWLEDISVKLIELHISKRMPVTVGVIPYLLDMPGGTLKDHLKKFYDESMIEIAQHGYDHNEYLEGMSYEEQKNIIKRGLNILLSLKIRPYTFIPPFGSADYTTIKVLNELGFHTLVNPIEDLESGELTVVAPLGVPLCKDNKVWYNCEFKSPEKLMKEMDEVIEEKGVISIYYHMMDVATEENVLDYTKFNQLSNLLDELKNSNKYIFMTAEEYHKFSTNPSSKSTSTTSTTSTTTTTLATTTTTPVVSTSTSRSIHSYVFLVIVLVILCLIIMKKMVRRKAEPETF